MPPEWTKKGSKDKAVAFFFDTLAEKRPPLVEQRSKVVAWCSAAGVEIVDEVIERGRTGLEPATRTVFFDLLDAVKAHGAGIVCVCGQWVIAHGDVARAVYDQLLQDAGGEFVDCSGAVGTAVARPHDTEFMLGVLDCVRLYLRAADAYGAREPKQVATKPKAVLPAKMSEQDRAAVAVMRQFPGAHRWVSAIGKSGLKDSDGRNYTYKRLCAIMDRAAAEDYAPTV